MTDEVMIINVEKNKQIEGTFNIWYKPQNIKVLALKSYQLALLKELLQEVYEAGSIHNGLIIKEEI